MARRERPSLNFIVIDPHLRPSKDFLARPDAPINGFAGLSPRSPSAESSQPKFMILFFPRRSRGAKAFQRVGERTSTQIAQYIFRTHFYIERRNVYGLIHKVKKVKPNTNTRRATEKEIYFPKDYFPVLDSVLPFVIRRAPTMTEPTSFASRECNEAKTNLFAEKYSCYGKLIYQFE